MILLAAEEGAGSDVSLSSASGPEIRQADWLSETRVRNWHQRTVLLLHGDWWAV